MEPLVILFVGLWVATGLALAWFMGRRGHSAYSWGVIGTVFGPLAAPLVVQAIHQERSVSPQLGTPGGTGSGSTDILVGLDGSDQSWLAAEAALRLAGSRIGRLTLATVIDYDLAESGRPAEAKAAAEQLLLEAAQRFGRFHPSTVVLAGPPSRELAREALTGGYDLLAVGCRGRGLSTRLLGSTATQLAGRGTVPVLVVAEEAGATIDRQEAVAVSASPA